MRAIKVLLVAAICCLLGASQATASIVGRLAAAQPGDLVFQDQSREQFLDLDNSGTISGGDVLRGFVRVDNNNPGGPTGTLAGHSTQYVVFSQTFDPVTFGWQAIPFAGPPAAQRMYSGMFLPTPNTGVGGTGLQDLTGLPVSLSAFFAAYDVVPELDVLNDFDTGVLPTMAAAISKIVSAPNTIAFTAGYRDPEDFFMFETLALTLGVDDFVLAPALAPLLAGKLGSFTGGFSILDNFLPFTTFNDVLTQAMSASAIRNSAVADYDGLAVPVQLTGGGPGKSYEMILENPAFSGGKNSAADFTDNVDARVNATVIPEPASFAIWGLLAVAAGALTWFRGRRRLGA
jgi:hypothetical protein